MGIPTILHLFSTYLVEYSLVRAQKTPLDITISKADVKHLAVGGGISIITIRSAFTGKCKVSWNFCEILAHYQNANQHCYKYKKTSQIRFSRGIVAFFDTVAEAEYFLPMFENGLL